MQTHLGCTTKARVIVRIFGGLGNQLFQYAAARRLALVNNIPLVLDTISGFQRDHYQRQYCLHHFSIQGDLANSRECFLGAVGRVERWLLRQVNQRLLFEKRNYVHEKFFECDSRLLSLKVNQPIYLEGYWQSVRYFEDIAPVLRRDLQFVEPHDQVNLETAERIKNTESVCLHVRRLRGARELSRNNVATPKDQSDDNENICYYKRAIHFLEQRIVNPHFYVFSDDINWVKQNFPLGQNATFIDHNNGNKDYEDLWLMSCCKYFILAYSTFSWWGAWLSPFSKKIVCAPFQKFDNKLDMMPKEWINI